MNLESIILGGGCFWCTEAVFQTVEGVLTVTPGYAGGTTPNPTYDMVSTGKTGHAEVVKVTFDPQVITLDKILEIFFKTHNPTTPNRQGADIGTQYRSTVFYTHPDQLPTINKRLESDFVTQIKPLDKFYEAEEYHHNYFKNHPEAGYCQVVIRPKLEKLQALQ